MTPSLTRRSILAGLIAAPAIVRGSSLMRLSPSGLGWLSRDFAPAGSFLTIEQITREAARVWAETSPISNSPQTAGIFQKKVELAYSGKDRHLSLADYSRRILRPAISAFKGSVPRGARLLDMQIPKGFDTSSQQHMPDSLGFRQAAALGLIEGAKALRVLDGYDIRTDSLITHLDVICNTTGYKL